MINNKNVYRKPQSNKDSNNKKKQTLEKHLHGCKNLIIHSNDYSDESNNKTNTHNNLINSERVSQIRRSYRIKKFKKGNEKLQQNKKKINTNGIQFKLRLKKKEFEIERKILKKKKTNIVERIGIVRNSKKTNNVGSNKNLFRNKHVATKKDNVPQQKVVTPSDDPA